MAIYEIARIQLRRGRTNNGTSVPQLASGEMAWAIDTQELYIGNGAVSEGAPYVGNTRVLTEKDLNQWGFFGDNTINIAVAQWQQNTEYKQGQIVANNISEDESVTYTYTFLCIESHTSSNTGINNLAVDFATDLTAGKWIRTPYIYTYKKTDVLTGPTANTPVLRSIEDRLSDRVSLLDFVSVQDQESNNYTVALSRAIDNLFDNNQLIHKAYNDPAYRVKLELPAGIYQISDTIDIPSYATIIGAGSDKTIFEFTADSGPIFRFISNPVNEQPCYINISGLSINVNNTTTKSYPLIEAISLSQSVFDDISIIDNWEGVYHADHCVFKLTGESDIVTCEKNIFRNIKISGVGQGVISDSSIKNNTFENMSISDAKYGFILGEEEPQYELKNNIIDSCIFTGIHSQAVFIKSGYNNSVINCRFINVGNNTSGMTETTPVCPQVYFNTANNVYQNNQSERTAWLSQLTTQGQFIPEVSGRSVNYTSHGTFVVDDYLTSTVDPILVIKLPLRTNELGTLEKMFNCRIEYNYEPEVPAENENSFIRRGTLTIAADYDMLSSEFIQLIDEFDYLGLSEEDALKIRFRARFIDGWNNEYSDEYIAGIGIFYTNSFELPESLSGILSYTYTINY